jgi:hypothetical protein
MEFEAFNHWINNPLIDAGNKIDLHEKAVNNAKAGERERIIKILDENLGNVDWEDLVALIRGEQK